MSSYTPPYTHQHNIQQQYGTEPLTIPNVGLGTVDINNNNGKVQEVGDDSTITPGVSCTSSEMKSLQEMSLGGGNLENEYNEGTATLVRRCTKDMIWTNTKFLTDVSMQRVDAMNCTETDGSIVGLLLKNTRFTTTDNTKKVAFWRVYGPVVQRELNELKSNRARTVKDLILKGEYNWKELSDQFMNILTISVVVFLRL